MSEERPDWTEEQPSTPEAATPATVPAASGAVAEIDTELAEIAQFRRENKSAYFKDDAMQERERELLDAKLNGPAAEATVPENLMHPSDVAPASIFASPDDIAPEAVPALDMAKAVLAEDAGWSNTIAGFTEHLTVAAQDALVAEMAGEPIATARPLTPDQIVQFTSTSEGRELWNEWGDSAPEKASTARARLDRLVDALPEHEIDVFHGLVESLPPAAFKEALRQLAG